MNDNDDFNGLTPEEKLQKENELLKLKLQSEFGMEKMDSSLDKETENKWLNDVYNFEKQFAENKQCKVYDFINRPKFRRVDELTKEEISKELAFRNDANTFFNLYLKENDKGDLILNVDLVYNIFNIMYRIQ